VSRRWNLVMLAAAVVVGAIAGRALFDRDATASVLRRAIVRVSPTQKSQRYSYGWPVKPFDRQHPIRGYFGDPRTSFRGLPTLHDLLTGVCACSYHRGIDISAPDGSPVYPVRSGVVRIVNGDWVRVRSERGVAFEYWHIHPSVGVGTHVVRDKTVLGTIYAGAEHIHLTQLHDGRAVNPLAPGNIGPYADTTPPRITAITFRPADSQPDLLPEDVHGSVELVAAAFDTPPIPVPGMWRGLPVSPARLSFHITHVPDGSTVMAERTVIDATHTLPGRRLWRTYARGTRMNMARMGGHRAWYEPGVYLFKLTRTPLDTRTVPNGVYTLTVTAWDTAGNHGSATQIFSVHNRSGYFHG
jgi:murein DD-endopeptidase MepM/ murein hydrolase activator NlpD